jgi:hypothetical protein
LNSVSLIWGLLLCLCAAILALLSAQNAQESIFYVCSAAISVMLIISCGFFQITAQRYDTEAPALKIAELMAENSPIGLYGGKYHGQYHFPGRLIQPIKLLAKISDLRDFANTNQNGYIIVAYDNTAAIPDSVIHYHYPSRSRQIGLLSCRSLLANPDIEAVLIPS